MNVHFTRTRAVLATVGLLLAVGAPTAYATLDGADAPTPTAAEPRRADPYVETQLFFGTARPDGGPAVTDRQFMAFVDKEVTPAFPDGLTIQSGRGQWRDASGAIEKERSYELILLYPRAEAQSSDRRIEEIRRAYEKAFGQEAVGRVDDEARVDF
ncbi:choline dehydrogenase [Streptomyces viridochromogenes]|uniref:Choline dehydrogenase n=1 Tax=Streptomyces viridochromogenes TaxID=1938 RepID=A0A0J8BSQ8_STRVR|nr:DUF3574 domain-containing protein [Streptomyces viridochromogenes]KMS68645.1 choline dehydrogenase [Streptomyces viridochromogenes]KOG23850.1 choline dehydrogenase [Streptomyces viridochromogenes]KOG24840.1 choline dehydrogenase [Streptomyces viridochromogenes]